MTRNWMKRGALVATACLASAGAVTATADQTAPEPAEYGAPQPATEAVEWAQSRRLEELRRERDGGDDIPDDWAGRIERDALARHAGANPDLARRVAPGAWLIPGDGLVCLASMSPRGGAVSLGCATPLQVEEGLLQPADLNVDGSGVITGVMPDGVDSVTIVDLDGSGREVAVDHNVYRAAIDADIKEVRWTDALGVERVRPMPWKAP